MLIMSVRNFQPSWLHSIHSGGRKPELHFAVRMFSTPWRLNAVFPNPLFFYSEVYNTDFIRQMHYNASQKVVQWWMLLFGGFSSLFFTYCLHSSNESIIFLVWDLKLLSGFGQTYYNCCLMTCGSVVVCITNQCQLCPSGQSVNWQIANLLFVLYFLPP